MTTPAKPLPTINILTRPFWEGTKRHELLLQRCRECGRYRFPPRVICPGCISEEFDWIPASGRGAVYTYTVVYRSPMPSFDADLPYVIGIIELEEGARVMSHVIGCRPEEVKVGLSVQLVFEDVSDEVSLYKFQPA